MIHPFYRLQILALLALLPISAGDLHAQELFRQTNGPFGGVVINGIVANDGTVYVVTGNFETFRSTNSGENWEHTDTTDPQWVEFVAADSSGRVFVGSDFGVWRSSNKGRSWDRHLTGIPQIGGGNYYQITSLEAAESGVLFAAYYAGPSEDQSVLYRSTDNGLTWAISLGIEEEDRGILSVSSAGGSTFAVRDSLILRSDDDGVTWRPTSPLPQAPSNMELLIAIENGSLWAFDEDRSALYYSSNRGDSWTIQPALGLPPNTALRSMSPRNGNGLVVTARSGIYLSTDAGASWKSIGEQIAQSGSATVASSLDSPLFALSNAAYRSVDNGQSWEKRVDGLIASAQYSLTETASGAILAGLANGIARSSNRGNDWRDPVTGFPAVRCLDLASFDDATTLAATATAGIQRSTDNGSTWAPANVGLTVTRVNNITITGASEAYAATSNGLFRTVDKGISWSPTGSGITTPNVYQVIKSGDRIVAAAGGIWPEVGSGIYGSTDNGATWTPMNSGLLTPDIYTLLELEDGTLLAGAYNEIYRSNDRGSTWMRVIEGWVIQEVFTLVRNEAGTIYAGIVNHAIRSTDNGITWSAPLEMPGANYPVVDEMLVARDGSIYATTWGAGVFRLQVDNGDRWQRDERGLEGKRIVALASRSINAKTAATDDGIYRIPNRGDGGWTRIDSGQSHSVRALVERHNGEMFFVSTATGVSRYVDSTSTWTSSSSGLPAGGAGALVLYEPTGKIFAATASGVYGSSDDGATWSAGSGNPAARVLALEITGSSTVLASTEGGGLYRSTDLGASWQEVTGRPAGEIMSFAPFGAGTIYAGTTASGIQRSTDDGRSWTTIASAPTTGPIVDLALNSNGFIFAGTESGIYRSTDDGAGWERVNAAQTGAVTAMMISATGDLYVGYEGAGLYRSGGALSASVGSGRGSLAGSRVAVAPNPIGTTAQVSWRLERAAEVTMSIVDPLGAVVAASAQGRMEAGEHTWTLDAGRIAPGTYLLVIDAGATRSYAKITIVR